MVYVGYYNAIYALDARTGATLWRRSGLLGGSAVVNGRVFVWDLDAHKVDALDANTGSLIWQSSGAGVFGTSTLTVANGSVFALDGFDGALFALDAQTGADRWGIGGNLASQAAVASGVAYLAIKAARTDAPFLVARDAVTGNGRWIDNPTSYLYPLLVANGILYGSGEDNNLYAINTDTGAILSMRSIGTHPTTAALVNGSLFIGGSDGNLYALRLPN